MSEDVDPPFPDYVLTPEQVKAFESLKRAVKKCSDEGIYLWDDYGTISGVNGRAVIAVCPDDRYEEKLDRQYVATVPYRHRAGQSRLPVWNGSNADDDLFINR